MKCVLRSFVILLINFGGWSPGMIEATTKKFVSSWDFANRNNWGDGNPPCAGDRVTFNDKPQFPLFLDGQVSFQSIEFEFDTVLLFGHQLSLNFNKQKTQACKDNDLESKFGNRAKGNWWDPDSWECASRETIDCNSAVPDIHRVPCVLDSVVTPDFNDSLFYLIFTKPTPTVKSLMVGKKNFSTSQFYALATSAEGRQRIILQDDHSPTPVYIENESNCLDITGCPCNPTVSIEDICKNKRIKCPKTTCTNPVKMVGFCCDMCGGELTISHNGSIGKRTMQDLLKRVLDLPESADVEGHVAKMPDDHYHVYFIPKNPRTDYQKALSSFVQLFGRELNKNSQHTVKINKAKGTVAEKLAKTISNSRKTTIVWVTFIVVLGIGLAYFLYKKKKVNELPFMFRRMSFSDHPTRSARRTSIPSSSHVVAYSSSEGRSFVNPTFNEDQNIDDLPSSITKNLECIPEVECPTQRENPLYVAKMEQGVSFNALKGNVEEDLEESASGASGKDDKLLDKTLSSEVKKERPNEHRIFVEEDGPNEENLILVDTSETEEFKEGEEDEEDPIALLAKSRVEDKKSDVAELI